MFITKRSLSRRTVLKGMGATLTLPFLDAMVPAATALAKTAAQHDKTASENFLQAGIRRPLPDIGGECPSPVVTTNAAGTSTTRRGKDHTPRRRGGETASARPGGASSC